MNKKILYGIVYFFILGIVWIISIQYIEIGIKYQTDKEGSLQIFYDNRQSEGYPFDENNSIRENIHSNNSSIGIGIPIQNLQKIRIDFEGMNQIVIDKIMIRLLGVTLEEFSSQEIISEFKIINDITISETNDKCILSSTGKDSFIGNTEINIGKIYLKTFVVTILISFVIEILLVWLYLHTVKGECINTVRVNIKEKILIILCCIVMIGPTIFSRFILTNNDVVGENRVLNEKPDLNIQNIMSYPSKYEAYYNDHIPLKDSLVFLNSKWKFNVLGVSPSDYVIKGKDNWLFYDSKYKNDADSLADYLGTNYYSREELDIIKGALLDKQEYLKQIGSEFYILICPNKNQIYSEYMPDYYVRKNEKSRTDILVEYLRENTDLNIIYPKEELLELKDRYRLYYKWDTHWNSQGAYVTFNQLMQMIDKGYSDIDISKIDFAKETKLFGDIANMINILPQGHDDEYTYNYKPEVISNLVESNEEGIKTYRYICPNADNKKLVMFRDSFTTALIPYLSKEFEESLFVWDQYFNRELIEKEKPDIVIYEVVERYIDALTRS